MLTYGWTDEQTYKTKLIAAFRNFANCPNNVEYSTSLGFDTDYADI
jgi:hypothetical protein